ncbi:MAG: pseudouridine-5'-phosphate glycosidase [Alphaproteobacteria bacterium]
MRAPQDSTLAEFLEVEPTVAAAVRKSGAVVALESSVIAAGLPHPHNLEAALRCEEAVRAEGAIPATVGVVEGRIKVGMSQAEIEAFATGGDAIEKASRRDLPHLIAAKKNGATTVAGTLLCAGLAGLRFFATGGIGGVHRGWQETLDVSADLEELPRSDMAVVCAGAKAILDLPATLEYLETRGVPVVGFGTDEFPAFYTRESGLPLGQRVDTAEEAARFLRVKWRLGLSGAVVIAQPIPTPFALDRAELERHIERALRDAEAGKIAGKDVTPFLLARIAESTGGASLKANLALLENNARLAGRIARAYMRLSSGREQVR